MDTSLLDIHALRQTFPRADGGELLVLDGIDLHLAQGQIVGLLGRTGSGKSTLLRSIAGLMAPSAGTITYLGRPVTAPAPGMFSMMPRARSCRPRWATGRAVSQSGARTG